jgi:PAS domain S-box-containing protein
MDERDHMSALPLEGSIGDREASILDATPAVLWSTDLEGRCTYLNRKWYKFTGQSIAETADYGWRDSIHPDDRLETDRVFLESLTEQKEFSIEYRLRRYDGVYRWVLDSGVPQFAGNTCCGFVGSIMDIHDRREGESRVGKNEPLFLQFNEHSSDVIWIRDAKTLQFEYVSPAVERVYGVSASDLTARQDDLEAWLDLLHPRDRANALEALSQVCSGYRVTHEFRVLRPDGQLRWVRDTDFPLTDEVGNVQRVAGIGQDITEEKRNESSLREREERLSIIVNNARDYAIFTTDESGIITDWREGAEAVFGWSRGEAIGMDSRLVYTHEDRAKNVAETEMQRARETGKSLDLRWHVRKDGNKVYIDGSLFRIGEGNTPGFLKIGQDITSRYDAANALKASEGRLQIVVAELQHRTRNLLGIVNATMSSTIRESGSLAEFEAVFTRRLRALARVNSLLSSQSEGERIAFDELIKMELEGVGAFDPDCENASLELAGPHGVELRSRTIQIFALAIHELATNAIKYGALSQTSGHLSIKWKVEATDHGFSLHVTWRESGVAMPADLSAQPGAGYGRELIEQALPYQLQADTTYSVLSDGICCVIMLPIETRELA